MMRPTLRWASGAFAIWATAAGAQGVPLLLYDGTTGKQFAGCLNCNRFDSASVCNAFGDYGSRFSDKSIWNQFGRFGSRFQSDSPWNGFGPGLRVVDGSGRSYGNFTSSTFGRSTLPIVSGLVELHERLDDLEKLREALCE